jgi:Adenylate and Guanylate cyclase catalytic domain
MFDHYNSLEDFLVSTTLHVDAIVHDGWGATFPVKGREIDATILFADITSFSERTRDLSPTETLIFVNNFFCWMSAEALRGGKGGGIVDKYIGDEMMVVYSKEFGSQDPFAEAAGAAMRMISRDHLGYCPHIGIASGRVTVGYVGTPIRYNCSVFGAPVALAARCASVKVRDEGKWGNVDIVFPAGDWGNRSIDEISPREKRRMPSGEIIESEQTWEVLAERTVPMKNFPDTSVRGLYWGNVIIPVDHSAAGRARESMQAIRDSGRYRPM